MGFDFTGFRNLPSKSKIKNEGTPVEGFHSLLVRVVAGMRGDYHLSVTLYKLYLSVTLYS